MLQLSLKEEPCQIGDRQFVIRELARGPFEKFLRISGKIDAIGKRYKVLHDAGQAESDQAETLKQEANLLTKPFYDSCLQPVEPVEHPDGDWYAANVSERMAAIIIEKQLDLNGYSDALGNLPATKAVAAAAQTMQADLQRGPILPGLSPESTT